MSAIQEFRFEVEIAFPRGDTLIATGVYVHGTCAHRDGCIESIELPGTTLNFRPAGRLARPLADASSVEQCFAYALLAAIERVHGADLDAARDRWYETGGLPQFA